MRNVPSGGAVRFARIAWYRVYPPIADETHEFFLVAPVVHRSDVVDSATF